MERYRLQVGAITSSCFYTLPGMITFVDGVEYILTSGASPGQTATVSIIPQPGSAGVRTIESRSWCVQ